MMMLGTMHDGSGGCPDDPQPARAASRCLFFELHVHSSDSDAVGGVWVVAWV